MSKAERMSINMIDITCPIVDEFAEKRIEDIKQNLKSEGIDWNEIGGDINILIAIYDLISDVKENATEKLREALIDACQRIVDLENGK
jgi:hypothetical protein